VLSTWATLADPSLDTTPVDGAIAALGADLFARDGTLVATDAGAFPRSIFTALIQLDDGTGAITTVRLDADSRFRGLGGETTAHLVRGDGSRSPPIPIPITRGTIELEAPASPAPLFLALHSRQELPQPRDRFPPDFLTLHAITLD
jgi:hypothetical protein